MKTLTLRDAKIFNYLNDLRDSGVTNMFGAYVYIKEEFDLDISEAIRVLQSWMKNFDGRYWSEGDEIKEQFRKQITSLIERVNLLVCKGY